MKPTRMLRTITRKPPELMFWNGGGYLLGYAGTCYFFCAAYSWEELLSMIALVPGYTPADADYIRMHWHAGIWGMVGAHLPREVGVWVQPHCGAPIKRIYPTVKRMLRSR